MRAGQGRPGGCCAFPFVCARPESSSRSHNRRNALAVLRLKRSRAVAEHGEPAERTALGLSGSVVVETGCTEHTLQKLYLRMLYLRILPSAHRQRSIYHVESCFSHVKSCPWPVNWSHRYPTVSIRMPATHVAYQHAYRVPAKPHRYRLASHRSGYPPDLYYCCITRRLFGRKTAAGSHRVARRLRLG